MDPFELIEEATKRANTLHRNLLLLSRIEPDAVIKERYQVASNQAEQQANELYDKWNILLNVEMQNWEARAGVTIAQFTNANAQLKRTTTDLANAVDKVESIVRVISSLATVVGIVVKIAAI
jgi:hypothetical protein